jgi:23S rRNA pseudouridine1911/1915/1917 synthase
MTNKIQIQITRAEAGRRTDQFLGQHLKSHMSRSQMMTLIKDVGIMVNGQVSHQCNRVLKEHDSLEVVIPEIKPFEVLGEDIPIEIIHEENDFLVLSKPSGLVVHPGAGQKTGTMVNALLGAKKELSDEGSEERPGIVHRLDKGTSGLILIAKTNEAHRKFAEMFSARQIKKTYLAVVAGKIEHYEGRIEEPIGRHEKFRTRMGIVPEPKGKPALTEYRLLENFKYSSYIEVYPMTGRTHQIRLHFNHIGHYVLGDETYGRKGTAPRLALHASDLKFDHPITGEPVHFTAPIPEDFQAILDAERNR